MPQAGFDLAYPDLRVLEHCGHMDRQLVPIKIISEKQKETEEGQKHERMEKRKLQGVRPHLYAFLYTECLK
jgi:hypothetical protein